MKEKDSVNASQLSGIYRKNTIPKTVHKTSYKLEKKMCP